MHNRIHLWAILVATVVVRLLTLGAYPLMDTTEARYGEMARLMVETGNWITPQFDYSVPFWGKPPLFTWMSALSIEHFGVTEFAVRFPHWLAGVSVLLLMALFARKQGQSGLITASVVATCGVFIVSAGAVMTDMALTVGMSLAMVGFYRGWQGSRIWGYMGFVGLAIGLLAKGPLIIVLVGIAVGPWLVLQHGLLSAFRVLWQRFPLITGTLLMLVLALPWYFLAEKATPGFVDYFIVGEHYKRFMVSGWEGDLYGTAHDEPRGTIWLFWLTSALPWSLVLPALLWRSFKTNRNGVSLSDPLHSFLWLWMVSPLLLFTLSGNILPAYVLPGIPALGVIVAMHAKGILRGNWINGVAAIAPVLLVGAVIYLHQGTADKRSDKVIFAKSEAGVPTYYVGKRPFSGQFYSQGQAKLLTDVSDLAGLTKLQLIGKPKDVEPLLLANHLSCVVEHPAYNKRALYHCTE